MIKNKCMITIAMITYNSEKYVDLAIKSILSSNYEHYELLIIDDSSTDNTWDIIKSYNNSKIKSFNNKINIGEYSNRNKCLEYAEGDYILYIDGDDYLYPHGINNILNILNSYPSIKIALMLPFNKNIIYPLELTPYQIYKSTFLGKSLMGLSLTNTIFQTEVLKKVGGFSTKFIAGDEHIRLKIASLYNVLLINDGFTWHRERPGQAFEKLSKHWGTAELINYSTLFLNDKNCPLNNQEKQQSFINIYGGFFRIILKYILKFKFKYACKLYKHSGIQFKYIFTIFKKPIQSYIIDNTNNQKKLIETN